MTVPIDQAIEEIVNGGKLFSHVPGEENRVVEGLKDIWVLRDPRVAKELADGVRAVLKAKDKKKAVVNVHRGIAQHTNGFYNVTSAMTLNLLLGNYDWKGGMIAASTYNTTGGKEGQPFAFSKMAPGKTSKFGISCIRHDVKYEDTTLFSGYPAKRNWWPLASDI